MCSKWLALGCASMVVGCQASARGGGAAPTAPAQVAQRAVVAGDVAARPVTWQGEGAAPDTSVDPATTERLIEGHRGRSSTEGAARLTSDEVLSPEQIREVTIRALPQIAECHERGLARDPNVSGRVVVRYLIGADGAVRAAGVIESPIADRAMLQCLVNVVRYLRFAPTGGDGAVTVNYPFNFAPPEPEDQPAR